MYAEHCTVKGEQTAEAKQRFGTSVKGFGICLFPCRPACSNAIFYLFGCVVERALERDHFMTAQEALEFGLIDKIVQKRGKKADGSVRS